MDSRQGYCQQLLSQNGSMSAPRLDSGFFDVLPRSVETWDTRMLNRNNCGAPRTLSLFGQRSPTSPSPQRKFTVRRRWNRTNVSNIQNTGIPVQIAGGRRRTVQSAFPPPPFARPCPAGDSSSVLFRSAQRGSEPQHLAKC